MKYNWRSGVDRATRAIWWLSIPTPCLIDWGTLALPHFTPHPSPGSIGVILFAQDLTQFYTIMQRPYVFPPNVLVGPVLPFLQSYRQSCTVVILDTYPRKYWWPLLQRFASRCRWFRSLVTSLKARLERTRQDPRGLVGLRNSFFHESSGLVCDSDTSNI